MTIYNKITITNYAQLETGSAASYNVLSQSNPRPLHIAIHYGTDCICPR